jgi:glycerophosphoryl diester phosphodiesterase
MALRRMASSPGPLVLAHRGASTEAPENTLAAFDLALRQGADGIELDVRFSADGVPVVIHDARVDRTTSGSGRVRRHTAKELRRLDAGSWFNRRFPGRARAHYSRAKIPQLAEAIAWVKDRGCFAVMIEVKGERAPPGSREERVLEIIHRAGVSSEIAIISFHLPTLRRLRELDGGVRIGVDFTRPLLALRRAALVDASIVLPHWAFASRRFIARAHHAGLRVVPWGLETPATMRRVLGDGVDGLITGQPACLRCLVEESRPWRPGSRAL